MLPLFSPLVLLFSLVLCFRPQHKMRPVRETREHGPTRGSQSFEMYTSAPPPSSSTSSSSSSNKWRAPHVHPGPTDFSERKMLSILWNLALAFEGLGRPQAARHGHCRPGQKRPRGRWTQHRYGHILHIEGKAMRARQQTILQPVTGPCCQQEVTFLTGGGIAS